MSTFVFAAAEPRLFRFQPGQYMTLELEAAGLQRCYTIASPPTRPWRIEVTAKRASGGAGSGWLHDHMQPGAYVRASGPAGDFMLEPRPGDRFLLLSAGSGITPVMSMARTLHDLGGTEDVLFVHSSRSPSDLIFADELTAMTTRPGFRRVSIVKDGAGWDGYQGRLSPALLASIAPDLRTRRVYCCGPAPYMAAVREMLDAAGFDRAHYHEESFDFAAPDAPAEALPPSTNSGAPSFTVRFARLGQAIQCPSDSTVLAAARAAGLRLPSACGKGVCGTCKSRLTSGAVELRHGGGIRQREIDDGMTLLCCARPVSDLVVDR